ncbi:uncharacterized protein K02A2.6-like [Wyeomyia smithii]|uniref:uncharacterized protein K02A2.6-like n=1 Tax=Wyeomyia smithii TaxID=174621 RepID=UPI002467DA9B|nr:uncharacterized protein K02A2.6-like [Wyeomyia smithii]
MGARDERVRDKGLESVMDLDDLTGYAINREILMQQREKTRSFKQEETIASVKQKWSRRQPTDNRNTNGFVFNKIQARNPRSMNRQNFPNNLKYGERAAGNRSNIECIRCGSWKHDGNYSRCPALGSRCHQCGQTGHFARKCKNAVQRRTAWKRPSRETNAVSDTDDWKDEMPRRPKPEDISEVNKVNPELKDGLILCMVDNLPIEFLIDSGSAINTVTEDIWQKLVEVEAKVHNIKSHCDRNFTAYASSGSLCVRASFEANITVNSSKPQSYAEFFVIKGATKSLLSKRTSEELRVLKVGLDVNHIETEVDPFPKFPNVQVKLSIDKSGTPRLISYLRVPVAMEKKVDDKILEMLRTDVIEKVKGPPEWISPMVVVPKGKDDVRLCINMKYPNAAIQREHYPLPVIDTFLNKLRGSKFFSRLDITSAFHHIELHPESRGVTTFMTSRGLMQFKRLNFGITCAPEIFQRVMTDMLAGIDGVIIYIDDVVVAGKTLEEHDERLQTVLSVLERNNALLNQSKCVFRVQELEILGFKVNAEGIRPSDEKTLAIKNFRRPETREEARSFLGLINFVGHFIPRLSTRTEPLRQFIRGEVDVFGKDQEKAFEDLRMELANNVRRLGFFDPADCTELYVDASPVGLGAVLVQRDGTETARIVSFASKGSTPSERAYPQTQREALAVVWAVEKFYFYLFGLHFTIFTDHKTLEYIYGGKHQTGRRACSRAESWALRLQPYDFEMKYLPGTSNISDILSRLITQQDPAFDDTTDHFLFAVGEGPTAISLAEIKSETGKDETLLAVIKALRSDEWPVELYRYQAFRRELGIVDGMVIRDERLVLPVKLRARALEIAHRGHPGVVSMRRSLRERVWWPCMDNDVTKKIQQCHGCAVVSRQNPPEPMMRKEMPERAWQQIAIDFFSAKECATFLVIVDYYSRFLKVIEMKGTTASKTIEALESVFIEQTYPESIRSDNGPPFTSDEFNNYCLSKNIRLIHTIPYWPQMNGMVERQNQGILRALRIAKASGEDWRKAVQEYVYRYNITPHSVTEKAPMEILTGRPVKDLLPSLKTEPGSHRDESVRESDAIKKIKGKLYADKQRQAKPSNIEVGDSVMLKNYECGKLETAFRLERFTVVKRSGSDVIVENEEGLRYRRCVTHLRKWPETAERALDPAEPESIVPEEANSSTTKEIKQTKRNLDATGAEESSSKRPTRTVKIPARYNS